MPHTQKQASPSDNQPVQRLLCPLETCQRVFKTKSACTSHVNSQHSGVDPTLLGSKQRIFLPAQKTPHPALANRSGIASLPSSPSNSPPPPMDIDAMHDILSDSLSFDSMSQLEDRRSSIVESSHNGPDHHPTINGTITIFLFVLF